MTMRTALTALVLLVLAPAGLAQRQDPAPDPGLVQLRFDGSLTRAARVEVEVGAMADKQARRLDVQVFLARGTTGADLATLVASRLESSGFHTHLGEPDGDAGGRVLFVEKALFINLRLGSGLRGSVTTCESVPFSLRVLSAPEGGADLALTVSAGVYLPATKAHSTREFTAELSAGSHAAACAERLLGAASKVKLASDRPKPELWHPMRPVDGGRLTGLSVSVGSGWRIEVQLTQQ